MKAVRQDKYGPPEILKLVDIPKPSPKSKEVLVKVKSVSVSSGEIKAREFKDIPASLWIPGRLAIGVFRPRKKVLGAEFSGTVDEVGSDVTEFKKGDEVFAFHMFGGNAEYVRVKEKGCITLKPKNVSFDEASAIPFGANTAKHFLEVAKVSKGDDVLINGAAGAVGIAAVQIAKYYGANVTGVCRADQAAWVKKMGASKTIDYKTQDFTKLKSKYDIVFDTFGNTDWKDVKKVLKPGGRYPNTVFGGKKLVQGLWTTLFGDKKLICTVSPDNKKAIEFHAKLIKDGKLKSKIAKEFKLEDLVEAHRYVEKGLSTGKVVVKVS